MMFILEGDQKKEETTGDVYTFYKQLVEMAGTGVRVSCIHIRLAEPPRHDLIYVGSEERGKTRHFVDHQRIIRFAVTRLTIFMKGGESTLRYFNAARVFTHTFPRVWDTVPKGPITGAQALRELESALGEAPGYIFHSHHSHAELSQTLVYKCQSPSFGPIELGRAQDGIINACKQYCLPQLCHDDTEARAEWKAIDRSSWETQGSGEAEEEEVEGETTTLPFSMIGPVPLGPDSLLAAEDVL
jgi:hypothetical protein